MSSDDAYSAFLDQANQDTGARATAASQKSSSAQLKTTDTEVPAALLSVEAYYVSEADEPFEPVSLKWTGRDMPSESGFSFLYPSLHLPTPRSRGEGRGWEHDAEYHGCIQTNSKISSATRRRCRA